MFKTRVGNPCHDLLQIQPLHLLRRQFYAQCGPARSRFFKRSWADQCKCRELLRQYPGKSARLMGATLSLAASSFARFRLLEVLIGVPDFDHLAIVLFVGMGKTWDEEPACLRTPGEQRQLLLFEESEALGPLCIHTRPRSASSSERDSGCCWRHWSPASRPSLHTRSLPQLARLTSCCRRMRLFFRRLHACWVHRQTRSPDNRDCRDASCRCQHDRSAVASGSRATVWWGRSDCSRAYARLWQWHWSDCARRDVWSILPAMPPLAPAVDEGGVEGVAAALEIVVEQHGAMRKGPLIVHAHDQPRDRLVQMGDLPVFHFAACRFCKHGSVNCCGLAIGSWFFLLIRQPDLRASDPAFSCFQVCPCGSVPVGLLRGVRAICGGNRIGFHRKRRDIRFNLDLIGRFVLVALDEDHRHIAAAAVVRIRLGQRDHSVAAKDADEVFLVDSDAAGNLREDVFFKFQHADCPFIHAGDAQVGDAFDFDRLGEILAQSYACDQTCHADSVATHVQDSAACIFVGEETAFLVMCVWKLKVALIEAHFANRAGFDQLDEFRSRGMTAIHEGFHHHHIVPCASSRSPSHRRGWWRWAFRSAGASSLRRLSSPSQCAADEASRYTPHRPLDRSATLHSCRAFLEAEVSGEFPCLLGIAGGNRIRIAGLGSFQSTSKCLPNHEQ